MQQQRRPAGRQGETTRNHCWGIYTHHVSSMRNRNDRCRVIFVWFDTVVIRIDWRTCLPASGWQSSSCNQRCCCCWIIILCYSIIIIINLLFYLTTHCFKLLLLLLLLLLLFLLYLYSGKNLGQTPACGLGGLQPVVQAHQSRKSKKTPYTASTFLRIRAVPNTADFWIVLIYRSSKAQENDPIILIWR